MKHASSLTVLSIALGLLAGCGNSVGAPEKLASADSKAASACADAYAEAEQRIAREGPVIADDIPWGRASRLFLSFDSDANRDRAVENLAAWSGRGYVKGRSLFAFRHLPIAFVDLDPAIETEVLALRSRLRDLGLWSIYPDYELKYLLDVSRDFIGVSNANRQFSVDGSGVGIAVVDSGLDETQGDFANLVEHRVVVAYPGPLGDPLFPYQFVDMRGLDSDTEGHGTHVSGIAAGTGFRSDGQYSGMAPAANLLVFSVGVGRTVNGLHAIAAYDYLLDPLVRDKYNLRVINNSYGRAAEQGGFDPYDVQNITSKRAHDLGVYPVFAAGNGGSPSSSGASSNMNPLATSPCVLAVAAGYSYPSYQPFQTEDGLVPPNFRGRLSSGSSRGVRADIDLNDHPDITAPGESVLSACALNDRAEQTAGSPTVRLSPREEFYCSKSGTSMASPHVAGVVALMLQADASLTLDEILDILTRTATPMFDVDGRPYEIWEAGAGFVNADAALARVLKRAAFADPTYMEVLRLDGSTSLAYNNPAPLMPADAAAYPFELPMGVYGRMEIIVDTGFGEYELELLNEQGQTVAAAPSGLFRGRLILDAPEPGGYTLRIKSINSAGAAFVAEVSAYPYVMR